MMLKRVYCAMFSGILCAASIFYSGCGLVEKYIKSDEPYLSYEAKLYNQTVDDFFAALDRHDAQAAVELFAPNVRDAHPELETLMNELMEGYRGPTDVCKRDGSRVAGSYHTDSGKSSSEVAQGFPVLSGKDYYWCDLTLMYENDWDSGEIGVKSISFYSAEYECQLRYAPDDAHLSRENTDGDADCPLDVELSRDAGYEVRMVGGYPMKFEPSDRRLTRDAVIQFFESPGSFSAFRSQFGEPNAWSISGVSCTYELEDDAGAPRYVDLLYNEDDDSILSAYIVNDLDVVGLEKLWSSRDSDLSE